MITKIGEWQKAKKDYVKFDQKMHLNFKEKSKTGKFNLLYEVGARTVIKIDHKVRFLCGEGVDNMQGLLSSLIYNDT